MEVSVPENITDLRVLGIGFTSPEHASETSEDSECMDAYTGWYPLGLDWSPFVLKTECIQLV